MHRQRLIKSHNTNGGNPTRRLNNQGGELPYQLPGRLQRQDLLLRWDRQAYLGRRASGGQ